MDLQDGGWHDRALARFCPRFKDWEFRVRSEHGPIDGANLLDWPIGLSDLEP